MKEDKKQELNKLAMEVINLSRSSLLVNLRFLDMALSMFQYFSCEESTYFTNGEFLIYNPKHVLKSYRQEKDAPNRDFLHIVMHCIFGHMFMSPTLNRVLWDLACDIAVENAINELDLKAVTTSRARIQQAEINKFKGKIGLLTAEKIYNYLTDEFNEREAAELRGYFYADNHETWYMSEEKITEKFSISRKEDETQNEKNSSKREDNSGNNEKDNSESERISDNDEGNSTSNSELSKKITGNNLSYKNSRYDLKEKWHEVSERMQTDLETFSKQHGDKAGGLIQNLKAVNREKYDYTAFLKKFAVLGETIKVNDDEFDYIFYTYGLKLYDKMPLVEPLEYKEVKRIKEFVIAIDTSCSVSGDLVQTFVQKTYNILKSTESFFSKINLHIIQCDADIQEHVKITTQEEFDDYLKTMKIKGLGGTDFRPVFNLVDKMVAEKEFVNLKGLIYFTDGDGDFPAQMPHYKTAIVFIDDDNNNPDVPSWAIKLVLQKNEI